MAYVCLERVFKNFWTLKVMEYLEENHDYKNIFFTLTVKIAKVKVEKIL